jgi:uracil-DNA glycosylase
MHPWPELKWWDCGERQVVEEKIDDLRATGITCYPEKRSLYKALSATPERTVRVAIIGQDPYPGTTSDGTSLATGVAFAIPEKVGKESFPHTLKIILGEYTSDLHHPIPDHGDLGRWTAQGVLLWNAIPSVQRGMPLSNDWDEWSFLTGEIVDRLSKKGIVFAFLGNVASRYAERVDLERNRVIRTSHPSPRGIRASKTPFTGSRIFSTINAKLRELDQEVVNWRLDDDTTSPGAVQKPTVGGGNVLQNVTGADLGGRKRQGTSPNIYASLEF